MPTHHTFRRLSLEVRTARVLIAAVAVLALMLAAATPSANAQDAPPEAIWDALARGGHVTLMRHARAPGVGDPDDFTLGDCSTQRLLSERGREQAARLGQLIRSRDIPVSRVYASQWCRTMETAELLDLAAVEPLPMINSFFRTPETADRQTRELAEFVSEKPRGGNILLVTHQVNIQALTGRFLGEGEIIVLEPQEDGFETIGTLRS